MSGSGARRAPAARLRAVGRSERLRAQVRRDQTTHVKQTRNECTPADPRMGTKNAAINYLPRPELGACCSFFLVYANCLRQREGILNNVNHFIVSTFEHDVINECARHASARSGGRRRMQGHVRASARSEECGCRRVARSISSARTASVMERGCMCCRAVDAATLQIRAASRRRSSGWV